MTGLHVRQFIAAEKRLAESRIGHVAGFMVLMGWLLIIASVAMGVF